MNNFSKLKNARVKFIDLLLSEGFVQLKPPMLEYEKEIHKNDQIRLSITAYPLDEWYSFVLYKYFRQEGVVHTGYLQADCYLGEPRLTNYRKELCEEDMAHLVHLMNSIKSCIGGQ